MVLVWTLAYGLYSVAVTPVGTTAANSVASGKSAGAQDTGSSSGDSSAGTTDTSVAAATGAGTAAGSTAGGRKTGAAAKNAPTAAAAGPGVDLGAPTGLNIHDADLYSGALNTRGITADSVKVCGHAPLIYGQLLNTKKEDLLCVPATKTP